MFCHMCGTQIAEGAGFCHKCGTKVEYEDGKDVQEKTFAYDDESAEEAEDKFNAILSKVGLDKVHTIKVMREWTGIEQEEAEALFEKVPVLLKKDMTIKEAEEIRAAFAKERAEITFTDTKGRSVNIDQWEDCDDGKKKTWNEKLFGDKNSKVPVFWRRFIGICSLFSCGVIIVIGFLMLSALFRLVFSSFIYMMIAVAVGYILYHKVIAEAITEFVYKRESKQLQLPEGMSASMLLEALSGKFNYPYFKGIHYGVNGECVIEGKYSIYPVIFKKYNHIVLDYVSKENNKKKRTVLLEAMAIRNYINKFFNPRLPIDLVGNMKRLRFAEGQRKIVAIVWAVASVSIVAAVVLDLVSPGSLQKMMIPGMEVRNSYLSQYSTKTTIGEAFGNFFEDGEWTKYDSEGYTNVVFTGSCMYSDEWVDVRVVFKLTGKNFIVDSLDIDGRTQSYFVLSALLSAVYEDY